MAGFGFDADDTSFWQPPEVIGEVVHWLATSPEADKFNGQCIQGQDLCRERNLLPSWSAASASA